jgi:hypothetical protein
MIAQQGGPFYREMKMRCKMQCDQLEMQRALMNKKKKPGYPGFLERTAAMPQ